VSDIDPAAPPAVCAKHGKPYCTPDDLAAYSARPECVAAGDCACHMCNRVCWHSTEQPAADCGRAGDET